MGLSLCQSPLGRHSINIMETPSPVHSDYFNYNSPYKSDPQNYGHNYQSQPGFEQWEPGEIRDFPGNCGSYSNPGSVNSSPVHHNNHRQYSSHTNLHQSPHSEDAIRKATGGKKRGPRPKLLTPAEKRQKRIDANDRERQRMGQLNSAFDHLRQVLPRHNNDRELSKFETVHLAKNYIRALNEMLSSIEDNSLNNNNNNN